MHCKGQPEPGEIWAPAARGMKNSLDQRSGVETAALAMAMAMKMKQVTRGPR